MTVGEVALTVVAVAVLVATGAALVWLYRWVWEDEDGE